MELGCKGHNRRTAGWIYGTGLLGARNRLVVLAQQHTEGHGRGDE